MNIQFQSLRVSATILAASSVGSYLFGLLRDRLLANRFGAGADLDVFTASFIVPDAIMNIFAAALTAAFIPVFSQWIHKRSTKQAWELVNTLLQTLVIIMVLAGAFAWLTMPWLAQLVAPGFDTERTALLIELTRWMLLSPILFGLSILFGSALQGMNRFVSYAISPLIYNVGIVLGIIILSPQLGIKGATYGVILGAALHMGVRLFELLRTDWKNHTWKCISKWPWKDEGVRNIIKLMIPRSIGLLSWQANLWIYTALASTLMVGSVGIFSLARNFQSLPVSMFGISLATALFPKLASFFAKDKKKEFSDHVSGSIQRLLVFTIPSAIGLMLLSKPLVSLFLGGGKFGAAAILATGVTLSVFALSVPLESTQHILARSFYARHDMITPVIVTLCATAVNVSVSWVAIQYIHVAGLALGFVTYSTTQVVLLSFLLRRKTGALNGYAIIVTISKLLTASSIMGVAVWLLTKNISSNIIQLAVGAGSGAIIYAAVIFMMNIPQEFNLLDLRFINRLKGSR